MTTRREFARNLLGTLAAVAVLGMSKCAEGGANAMLNSLRNVLKAVDKALQSLTLLGALLPDIVHTVAAYLTAVTQFVDDAATILEDAAKSAAQKASDILAMVGKVILPAINNPQVTQILALVDAALNLFLAFFGGSTKQPRGAAQAKVPGEMRLSDSDRRYLETIEGLAVAERTAVAQWAEKAGGH